MKHSHLRNLVRLIIEDNDRRKANVTITNDVALKILDALNAEIVPRGESEYGYLGTGLSNVAYEVIWNGKHSVAKIGLNQHDFNASRRMKTIKERLDSDVGKHLPTIYLNKVIKGDLPGQFTQARFYVTMVEYLKPLPTSIKALIFDDTKSQTFQNTILLNMKKVLEHPDELKSKISEIVEDAYWSHSKNKQDVHKRILTNAIYSLTVSFIKDKLNNCKNGDECHKELLRWGFLGGSEFKHVLNSLHDDNKIPDTTFDVRQATNDIKNIFYHAKNTFPIFHDEVVGEPEFKDKRIQEFYDAMVKLKQLKIANWHDLHRENVMMRDDKTLVASDIGNFSYPGNIERNKKSSQTKSTARSKTRTPQSPHKEVEKNDVDSSEKTAMEAFNRGVMDDEQMHGESLLVDDETKKKLDKWLDGMGLKKK